MTTKTYYNKYAVNVVSSVRVEPGPRHDRVSVWNKGGLAGSLTVDAGDGEYIAARLLPTTERDDKRTS